MTHESALCTSCRAPLPPSNALEVRCTYCGAVARRSGATKELVKVAVREVLREGAPDEPRARPSSTMAGVMVVFFVAMFALAGVWASRILRHEPVARVEKRAVVPVVPKPPPPPTPAPVKRPPPPPSGRGTAVGVDEAGDVVAVLGSNLVKADARSLEVKWATRLRFDPSSAVLVFRGARIVLLTGDSATFVDSHSGEVVSTYVYKTPGILEKYCSSGASLVSVYVLGPGTLHFDATTGQKVSQAAPCRFREPLECPSAQRCGWEHLTFGEFECTEALHAEADVFRSCDVDDGQRTEAIVALRGGHLRWKAPNTSASQYFGVVDGTLFAASSQAISALDPATGVVKWQRKGRYGNAVTSSGTVLYATDAEQLVAIDRAQGEVVARLRWREPSE